ncbi:MAG: hypothetical protein PHC91_03845 [Eubacteriales bacterium]|nr:hypothetical protein [Eubacteriales bacterium]
MKKKVIALLLVFIMVFSITACSGASGSGDEDMTIAGTPRSETLIVDPVTGASTNPTYGNPYLTGTDLKQGLQQLAICELWGLNFATGV